MKPFLNNKSYKTDAFGVRHYNQVDVEAMKYNELRKKLEGKKYNRYEIVALLSKKLDYYLSFDILPTLISYGLLVKPSRGIYSFPSKPIFKTHVYTCLAVMRAKRLGNV